MRLADKVALQVASCKAVAEEVSPLDPMNFELSSEFAVPAYSKQPPWPRWN